MSNIKLYMNNVGFGDCFVLDDHNERLLVDCGTRSSDSYLKESIGEDFDSFVNNTYCNKYIKSNDKSVSLLLTHFHTDHYNGFKKLPKEYKFLRMYLPFIDIDKRDIKKSVIVNLAIDLYFLAKENKRVKKHCKNILKHLSFVIDHIKVDSNNQCEIYYPIQGDKIKLGNHDYDVLWPKVGEITTKDNFIRLAKKIDTAFTKYAFGKDFIELRRQLLTNMAMWYEEAAKERSNYNRLKEISYNQDEILTKIDGLSLQCIQDIENINNICNLKNDYICKLYINDNNKASIVFHYDNYLLMTGDITAEIIQDHLLKFLNKYYIVVKAPHHGAEEYYVADMFEKAEYMLISTGRRYPYKDIGISYYENGCIQDNGYNKIYCTSGRDKCSKRNNGKEIVSNCFNRVLEIIFEGEDVLDFNMRRIISHKIKVLTTQ